MHREPDGLVISLREAGFFESGSAQMKSASQAAFDRIANMLRERDYRLRIEGHTDDAPIHNSQFLPNWELSTSRATEIVRLLIVREGVRSRSSQRFRLCRVLPGRDQSHCGRPRHEPPCGYCHHRQGLDGDSYHPSRDPSHNKNGKTVHGCRPQARGRKVCRSSSTAVVPSRARVRRECQNTARFPRTPFCDKVRSHLSLPIQSYPDACSDSR